jgi:hypothetical protein
MSSDFYLCRITNIGFCIYLFIKNVERNKARHNDALISPDERGKFQVFFKEKGRAKGDEFETQRSSIVKKIIRRNTQISRYSTAL